MALGLAKLEQHSHSEFAERYTALTAVLKMTDYWNYGAHSGGIRRNPADDGG